MHCMDNDKDNSDSQDDDSQCEKSITHSDSIESDDPLSLPTLPKNKKPTIMIQAKTQAAAKLKPKLVLKSSAKDAKGKEKGCTDTNQGSNTEIHKKWVSAAIGTYRHVTYPSVLDLILLVPVAKANMSQGITLSPTVNFSDILSIIYDTIWCLSITKKLDLTYQLSTSTAKSQLICLGCGADWDRCRDDIVDLEKKKGGSVTINILIPALVSIP